MTIEDKIKKALAEDREISKTDDFNSLRDFYEEMKKEGIAIKKEYDLPPLDTVGRRLYQSSTRAQKRQR